MTKSRGIRREHRVYRHQELKALELECIKVIKSYQARLSLRQIFYRLVAANVIDNSQSQYKRVGRILSAARWAERIDPESIVDRSRTLQMPIFFKDPADILQNAIRQYQLDTWAPQPIHCELWVEKDSVAGTLLPVAHDLRVGFLATHGYPSDSIIHEAARRFKRLSRSIIIAYAGDWDLRGEHIPENLQDKFERAGCERFICKVNVFALTGDQVSEHNLPTQQIKSSDTMYEKRNRDECVELDALDPAVLAQLARKAIERWIRVEDRDKVLAQEVIDKDKLSNMANIANP